ncbi:MAG: alpha/beta hydrolase [Gammaproteobacteria bacterium]|jgi:pimeloyl-ACP methyl ester carboxylesterase
MNKCKVQKLNVSYFRLAFLLLFITVLSLSIKVEAASPSTFQTNEKPYPGELINIGSHRLHIHCVGEGSPTIVIDSGIGGFSLEWSRVQNKLSNEFRVCSYDRAGYGWSDAGPKPRTTARISRELHVLLSEANVQGPYILVGHSFGGYNIRYFASEYPDLVAGMVFVDASHPEQFNTEEFKRIKPKTQSSTKAALHKNSVRIKIMRPVISKNFPLDKAYIAYQLMSSYKSKMAVLNESELMDLSAEQVLSHCKSETYSFPVVIITRGKRVWPHNEIGDRREQKWANLQNDLENLALDSEHFMAYKSGHAIHLDQPKLVTKNILLAANKARQQIIREVIKKYDFRDAKHLDPDIFAKRETTFKPSSLNLEYYLVSNAPTHKTDLAPQLLYLRNRKLMS